MISEPRRRTQIKRYGHDEAVMDMSDLESSSAEEGDDQDNDTAIGVGRGRGARRNKKLKKLKQKFFPDGFVPKEGEVVYGAWTRSECFKVERGLLTFGSVRMLTNHHLLSVKLVWLVGQDLKLDLGWLKQPCAGDYYSTHL